MEGKCLCMHARACVSLCWGRMWEMAQHPFADDSYPIPIYCAETCVGVWCECVYVCLYLRIVYMRASPTHTHTRALSISFSVFRFFCAFNNGGCFWDTGYILIYCFVYIIPVFIFACRKSLNKRTPPCLLLLVSLFFFGWAERSGGVCASECVHFK